MLLIGLIVVIIIVLIGIAGYWFISETDDHDLTYQTSPPVAQPSAQPAVSPPVAQPTVSPPVAQPAVSPPVAQPAVSPPVAQPAVSPPVAQPAVSPPVAQPAVNPQGGPIPPGVYHIISTLDGGDCKKTAYVRAKPCNAWAKSRLELNGNETSELSRWRFEATGHGRDVYRVTNAGDRSECGGGIMGARGTGCDLPKGMDHGTVGETNDPGLWRVISNGDGTYMLQHIGRSNAGSCMSFLRRIPCNVNNSGVVKFGAADTTSGSLKWFLKPA